MNCKWVSSGLFSQVQDLLKLWFTATGETGQKPVMDQVGAGLQDFSGACDSISHNM